MKRLTVRIDGSAYCLGHYQNKHCNVKRCGCCEINDEIIKKLADYEDTGMTPEQVIEMQMDWVAMKAAYPKWIPVTGKPPKEDGTYFVTFSDGTRSTVGYGTCRMTVFGRPIGHGWYDLYTGSYYADGCIIAWMPLPEQYRE